MSDLIIIHHSFQSSSINEKDNLKEPAFLMWETCRRQIFFSEEQRVLDYDLTNQDEIFLGLDAEEFLIQVLCGLKSPLVGETEVFGQFKNWWQNLKDADFKNKFDKQVQQIFSVVKRTREENLYGLGSQSYGSLLRKKMTETKDGSAVIDFIGAGQLVEEMIPWIEKKWAYRIWCRDTGKVKETIYGSAARDILHLNADSQVAKHLVVAAPLSHDELNIFIKVRQNESAVSVYDFRKDSATYQHKNNLASYSHLDDFTTDVANQQESIQANIKKANNSIAAWKAQAEKRAHVRPFGWDDL